MAIRPFIHEDFLLTTKQARELYHRYAEPEPIFDYHCHLPPQQIAENHGFENLTQIWLQGDHYKWRAMRINGVDESYITGTRTDEEKFTKWAETVPHTLRNPLFHWTHLELQRYFGIDQLLNAESAKEIYNHCNLQLQTPEFRVEGLLKKMKVEVVCTTDDPADNLEHHRAFAAQNHPTKMLPAFRPDKALAVNAPATLNNDSSHGRTTGNLANERNHAAASAPS